MRFEWDPAKSSANKRKHGIDFEEAQAIWDDADRVEIPVRRLTNELRSQVIGRIGATLWTAIITYRHDQTTIRLISVRHPHRAEVRLYRAAADDQR